MKPKVLVCVLTGTERQNWINPELSRNLVRMARDARFEVNYYPVCDCRPWEAARNMTIGAARENNADWLVSFDNDNFVPGNPLDIIAQAGKDQHVIGLPYVIGNGEKGYHIFPGEQGGSVNGPFSEVESVGGGVLVVRNTVWQTIKKGPWFRYQHTESESLMPGPGTVGEDVWFCCHVKAHGLRVWTHRELLAGHYRTTDITAMVR